MPVILIAEDDDDIRDLVEFKLANLGLEVVGVGDGATALARVREVHPDLVILDVNMPELSGIDVCRALRSDPEFSALPVLMLTANVQDADVQRGFDAGADDYVAKPFSPRELTSRVQALLARRSA
ncbi:response regulator receiver domain-containing protein [Motilibacter rhizosphaerae]|uniref:Response regulator receiver domain-containing protein n=1 Tax=Motilibacter rhizosphaerae TaxID=598652 RepID=A0A4Q7NSD4_9ACTN|nr:response regulator [Motilibacter rhizosphaerae]RZS89864.1 response regulator receiver domain-containing protein [Motilibacter rhizosphaerae]